MSNISIRADKLSKRYRLGERQAAYSTLRDIVTDAAKAGARRLLSRNHSGAKTRREAEILWALADASFEIKQGEVVGLIGQNGAGKSTLLKILSRITEPTSGYAELHGRVGSLLEVGTGFHGELTGRENVYLSGTILGMTRAEIERSFDDIVAFSEVEKFIDTPVKHYSSGMYLRLAFAVAAFLEPEILMVDEVLAVGDAAFQKKCLGKMGDVAGQGRTVVFVSHNMSAVAALCNRAICLRGGRIVADGEASAVISEYLSEVGTNSFTYLNDKRGFRITAVRLRHSDGLEDACFVPGEDLVVDIEYEADRPLEHPSIYLVVKSAYGSCLTASMLLDGQCPDVLAGRGRLRCTFKEIPLLTQNYTLAMGVRAADGKENIVPTSDVAGFRIEADLEQYGFRGDAVYARALKSCPVVIPYDWEFDDGKRISVALTSPNKYAEAGVA